MQNPLSWVDGAYDRALRPSVLGTCSLFATARCSSLCSRPLRQTRGDAEIAGEVFTRWSNRVPPLWVQGDTSRRFQLGPLAIDDGHEKPALRRGSAITPTAIVRGRSHQPFGEYGRLHALSALI